MKKLFIFFIVVWGTVWLTPSVKAIYDPRKAPNNQFGIHVVDPTDIDGVQKLLNSNGGSWGYVKVVIPETDRNTDKWNNVFREFRRRKLIPIVRLATHMEDDRWAQPTEESLKDWPVFLNSLSWPVENRYVVLFNEPNHAPEWGGSIDPEHFARTSVALAHALKEASEDYFLLPAGLDVSAQTNGQSLNAETYLKKIQETVPEYFEVFDGWTSHSYPNPAFSAPPTAQGRGSLYSYRWEIALLRSFGITKNYPILIGETGWTHSGGLANRNFLPPVTVASYITQAGETVWRDSAIFAVTPFLYNYESQPFDSFSWKKIGSQEFHEQYYAYQALNKTEGKPQQRESYELQENTLPDKLVGGSLYEFSLEIKNTGQAIITGEDNYWLFLEEPSGEFSYTADLIQKVEPEETIRLKMAIRTPQKIGEYPYTLQLRHGDESFAIHKGIITVIPPPSLKIEVQLGWRNMSEASQAAVLVYDGDKILDEFKGLPVENGQINTPGLLSIVPGQYYRVVTIVPYYLPRQNIQIIESQITTITNHRFFPIDTNNDQQFTWSDITTLLKQRPSTVLPRFFDLKLL